MSITEFRQYIYDNFAQDYSREVLLKYAGIRWNDSGKTDTHGYRNGVKKNTAGYDVLKGFALWMLKNVKTRSKRSE